MIGQYRVHDYGMERCALVSTMYPNPELASINQTLTLMGNTSVVEVWNLTESAGQTPLDAHTLSWAHRPARSRIVARFPVVQNTTTRSEDFYCGPSGSLQTFELACRGSGCNIEFWQNFYIEPRFGESLAFPFASTIPLFSAERNA